MDKKVKVDQSVDDYLAFMDGAVASFAPGRIEFLGNHLDYNGGIVLGTAINAGIYGVALPMEGTDFSIFSESFEGAEISGSIEKLEKQSGKQSWGNYCLGVLHILQKRELAPLHGFSLSLTTDLPMSAGLSSSAAVELVTAQCLLQLANHQVSKKELVNICRQAENEWVGLPCGILDQGTSAFGENGQVVQIDCAKEEFSTVTLTPQTSFWIFDTGIKHDLIDSQYSTRNMECTDALKILQKSNPSIKYLAECPSSLLDNTKMAENLKKRARHVVEEQNRVNLFIHGLNNGKTPRELGSILTKSHISSSRNFENSTPELDFLVDQLNREEKILGARLTGGGFGGAVLAWTLDSFTEKDAISVARAYEKEWQSTPSYHSFLPSKGASPYDPLLKS
jgi:galactokinase